MENKFVTSLAVDLLISKKVIPQPAKSQREVVMF